VITHSALATVATTNVALGPEWLDPTNIIEYFGKFGVAAVLAIVFIESGLLVGFFLPGDSLLFTAGLFSATHPDTFAPLWVLLILVPIAAITGDQLGYFIGRKTGPAIFNKPDSRFFKQEYVDKSHDFFEKYGPKTVVLARFVPIVRTFVPVIAGVSKMSYRTFVTYNIIGGVLWGVGLTSLGFILGDKVPWVSDNLDIVIILIVFLSVLPMIFEVTRGILESRRLKRNAQALGATVE
jgi:membrane-associated protein